MLLFSQTHPIPLHAIAAILAIILGGMQLYMKKGGVTHKLLGYVWENNNIKNYSLDYVYKNSLKFNLRLNTFVPKN